MLTANIWTVMIWSKRPPSFKDISMIGRWYSYLIKMVKTSGLKWLRTSSPSKDNTLNRMNYNK